MDARDVGATGVPQVGARRMARRARRLMAVGLVGVLAWTGVSFLAGTGGTTSNVSILPGASASGRVADVLGLTDTVTTSKGNGNSYKQSGVKFARIDVAQAYQNKIRVSLVWQNPSEFAVNTGTGGWQVRLGLYYPVHTGACTGTATDDANYAVSVDLMASESYTTPPAAATFCAYRDTAATGPGALTTPGNADQGTQLLASNWLLGTLQPKTPANNPLGCTSTGTVACLPTGLGTARRTYFVIGTLLNPGSKAPPGHVDDLLGLRLFVRASKVGA